MKLLDKVCKDTTAYLIPKKITGCFNLKFEIYNKSIVISNFFWFSISINTSDEIYDEGYICSKPENLKYLFGAMRHLYKHKPNATL